ncbi:hypothetical protein [Pedobacter sp. SYSU D00535]|uniref:hypothetical protein n=1 Tax=Pedobacter sp. SYSU D00535 TaxID=2810308 RepID=UPI001A96C9AE|nr:hypothetical protein [Pedobacter sp. SYSU D00535]
MLNKRPWLIPALLICLVQLLSYYLNGMNYFGASAYLRGALNTLPIILIGICGYWGLRFSAFSWIRTIWIAGYGFAFALKLIYSLHYLVTLPDLITNSFLGIYFFFISPFPFLFLVLVLERVMEVLKARSKEKIN